MTDEITYYIRTYEREYCIREIDPDDSWDIGDYGLEYDIKSLHRNKVAGMDVQSVSSKGYSHGCVQVDDIAPGDTAFVVHVAYDTGCTFGYNGTYCVAAIVKDYDEARKIQMDIQNDCLNKDGRGYWPWQGYFEHVTGVRLDTFTVA